MKTMLPILLVAAALSFAVGCKNETQAKPNAPAKADKMADKKEGKSDKMDAKKADKMADKKADKMDAKKDAKPADKMGDKMAKGSNDKMAAGAGKDLPPGKNDKSFLENLPGEGDKVLVQMTTSHGEIECTLFDKQTPETVMNFVGLMRGMKKFKDASTKQFVKRPFYDGIAFHRVIPKFMIQVGDPTGRGNYNPGYRFANEIVPTLKHNKGGLLSMANAGPGTNGSQIFITEVATPWLDGKHTVFGECTKESIEVVKKIARVPTGPGNKPLKPVTIDKTKVIRGK